MERSSSDFMSRRAMYPHSAVLTAVSTCAGVRQRMRAGDKQVSSSARRAQTAATLWAEQAAHDGRARRDKQSGHGDGEGAGGNMSGERAYQPLAARHGVHKKLCRSQTRVE